MPDWTYQTVFRPLLRYIPYSAAQRITFLCMGRMGKAVAGRAIIRFMGHASPSESVAVNRGAIRVTSPVALGSGVDIDGAAVSATALFGFGMIETGPVAIGNVLDCPPDTATFASTEWHGEGILIGHDVRPLATVVRSLKDNTNRNDAQIVVRVRCLADVTADDVTEVAQSIAEVADGVALHVVVRPSDTELHMRERLAEISHQFRQRDLFLLLVVEAEAVEQFASEADFFDGLILESGHDRYARRGLLGDQYVTTLCENLSTARDLFGERLIVASGGIHEPDQALKCLCSGADCVMVDSGFVDAGPGLPKRINLAFEAANWRSRSDEEVPLPQRSWFWVSMLGAALTIGGLIIFGIGWTRIVLPYDEAYLGMLRDEICSINPRLLPFMSHDRVTLAGTMLALGPLYLCLAWFGDRRGMHWARVAVLASGFVGFLSFFLFLGFGYFDPLHAFVSAVLFQMMTLSLMSKQSKPRQFDFDLHNSAEWRRAMWAQLLMVVHGVAILSGGVVISLYGVTDVFVAEDLAFMQTTRDALVNANPRLVPIVAHDRASFGGMLMSTGITVLLIAMWGWQKGRRWLWWALAVSGTVAYTSTISIHWSVGYTSLKHLAPAYGGLLALWVSLLLARPWMLSSESTRLWNSAND